MKHTGKLLWAVKLKAWLSSATKWPDRLFLLNVTTNSSTVFPNHISSFLYILLGKWRIVALFYWSIYKHTWKNSKPYFCPLPYSQGAKLYIIFGIFLTDSTKEVGSICILVKQPLLIVLYKFRRRSGSLKAEYNELRGGSRLLGFLGKKRLPLNSYMQR